MLGKTRWKCYKCRGKGTTDKGIEKPISSGFLSRIFSPRPPKPEFAWIQEKCMHCNGAGVLILSFEEVQQLEKAHDKERDADLKQWGVTTLSRFLMIEPIDPPIRPPQSLLGTDHDTFQCAKCGYTAKRYEFPLRGNTVPGGDPESEEMYCPRCKQHSFKDITPDSRTNWDRYSKLFG